MEKNPQAWFKPYIPILSKGVKALRGDRNSGEDYKTGHSRVLHQYLHKQTLADAQEKEAYFALVICLKLCGMQKDGRARAEPKDPIMDILTGPAQDVARKVVEYRYGNRRSRRSKGELRWKDIWIIR